MTKQAVTRKLGHEEDQHVVASDCELDAKLDLFRFILDLRKFIKMLNY